MLIDNIIGSRKIFFITGKGGTGKSTFTVVLGRLSALKYKTLIVDFDNKRSTIREILKTQLLSTEPSRVEENLYFSHIEPEDALRYYLNDYLRSEFLINLALNLKPLKSFYNALPSGREMLITYFLLHLIRDYDFEKVFIDMPSSGHAELFLKIPIAARGIFKKGPVIDIVNEMNKFLYRPQLSGVIQISLPEEVVVSETIEFYDKFNAIENISVVSVIVNKVFAIKEVRLDCPDIPVCEEIKILYNYYLSKAAGERSLIGELIEKVGTKLIEVPLFVGSNPEQPIFEHLTKV